MVEMYQPETPLPADAAYRVSTTRVQPALLLPGHDPIWETADRITWGPETARTSFAALWNDQGLAVRFDACDERPWHTMTRRDDPIWDEEVVEIFIDPARTGRNYLEIELSPINVVTDLIIRSATPTLDNDLSWNWQGLESTVVPGTCAGMRPGSWVALAWLPWSGLVATPPEVARLAPPKPGDAWRFNVFRIKRPGGPSNPRAGAIFAAWSTPTGRTFHEPGVFRDLIFA